MKTFLAALATTVAALVALPAAAQYPAKPVRLLVGFAPGGGVDIIARLVAQKLGEQWGKPVVVDNRGGAAGNIATEIVAKSAPDGYTLLMAFSSHASNPALYEKLPFDVERDFTAVTLVATAPVLIVVNAQVPAKNVAGLIALAKARPGELKFASSGVGTPVHLAGELMSQLTGMQMVHVPYKGIALAMTAILAGDIQITYATPLSAYQHLKNGRLVALAVAAPNRYPTLPEVPTAAEAGIPGYNVDFWYALIGPGRMPRALVDRIQRDVAAIVNAPAMKESLLAQGVIAVGGKPAELDALIAREYEQWVQVVKARNVKFE